MAAAPLPPQWMPEAARVGTPGRERLGANDVGAAGQRGITPTLSAVTREGRRSEEEAAVMYRPGPRRTTAISTRDWHYLPILGARHEILACCVPH